MYLLITSIMGFLIVESISFIIVIVLWLICAELAFMNKNAFFNCVFKDICLRHRHKSLAALCFQNGSIFFLFLQMLLRFAVTFKS